MGTRVSGRRLGMETRERGRDTDRESSGMADRNDCCPPPDNRRDCLVRPQPGVADLPHETEGGKAGQSQRAGLREGGRHRLSDRVGTGVGKRVE